MSCSFKAVLVTSSFLVLVINCGAASVYGQLYMELIHVFSERSEVLMLVISVQTLSLYLIGPLVGTLCKSIGERYVGMIGGLLAAVGYILSAFAYHISFLFIGYGFFLGITTSGCGFGVFLYGVFFRWLLDSYGWRGALLILSAVYVQCIIFSAIMISPQRLKQLTTSSESTKDTIKANTDRCISDSNGSHDIITIDNAEINSDKDNVTNLNNSSLTQTEEVIISKQKKMFEALKSLSFLTNPYVILICLSALFYAVQGGIPFQFFPLAFDEKGISKQETAYSLSAFGLADTFGRIIFGFVAVCIKSKFIYCLSSAMLAVAMGCLVLCDTFVETISLVALYGMFYGALNVVKVTITVDVTNARLFSQAYGFILLCQAIGLSISTPMGAYIAGIYDTYSVVLIAGALCSTLTSIFIGIIIFLDFFELATKWK